MAKSGSNKSARIHAGERGTKGEQPWFAKNRQRSRARNKQAKQSRKANRKQ